MNREVYLLRASRHVCKTGSYSKSRGVSRETQVDVRVYIHRNINSEVGRFRSIIIFSTMAEYVDDGYEVMDVVMGVNTGKHTERVNLGLPRDSARL